MNGKNALAAFSGLPPETVQQILRVYTSPLKLVLAQADCSQGRVCRELFLSIESDMRETEPPGSILPHLQRTQGIQALDLRRRFGPDRMGYRHPLHPDLRLCPDTQVLGPAGSRHMR